MDCEWCGLPVGGGRTTHKGACASSLSRAKKNGATRLLEAFGLVDAEDFIRFNGLAKVERGLHRLGYHFREKKWIQTGQKF